MLDQVLTDFFWLLTRWWFWLLWLATAVLGWFLLAQRSYKEVNGGLLVRHGKLGRWVDVEEHLKLEHPLEWAILEEERKKKGKEK